MGEFVNGIAVKGECLFQLCEVEEAEKQAAIISAKQNCPVLSAYIYDGDFWGYTLYINGEMQNEFSTLPEYFEEGEAVIQRQTADLLLLARSFGVAGSQIKKYLCHWTDEMLEEGRKAYEDDKFSYGDVWQVVDFLEALGFHYPEQQLSNTTEETFPTLLEILEQNLSPLKGEKRLEEYTLINKLPSAFSHEYIRHLLEEEDVKAFGFDNKTPQNVIEMILEYCLSVSQAERDSLCQRLNVLAAYCSFWLHPGNGWRFLDGATYEPVCISYEKTTDVYLLRARAAITDSSKRHRALRDLKRLLELDPENFELYQAEIKKWEER